VPAAGRSRARAPPVAGRARGPRSGAPAAWIERVREVTVLDEAGERGVFGESLPPGLRLLG
jgi:hypothetical protein